MSSSGGPSDGDRLRLRPGAQLESKCGIMLGFKLRLGLGLERSLVQGRHCGCGFEQLQQPPLRQPTSRARVRFKVRNGVEG